MSTTPTVPAPDSLDLESLRKRFEKLKEETEALLNKMATDGQTLQTQVKALADSQVDITKKLNMAIDEIRSIGGRVLHHADPEPAIEVKEELGITLFDLFD